MDSDHRMTATAHPISGNLVAFDEAQRTALIVGAVDRGPIAVLGDAHELTTAFRDVPDVAVVDVATEPAFTGTLIARSLRGETLPSDVVEQLVAHARAGHAWIADTAAGDPARLQLTAIGQPVKVIAEVELNGTLLAPEDAELEPSALLISDVPVTVGAIARRQLLFGALDPVDIAPPGRVRMFPTTIDDVVRLTANVRELEHTNRRLAEGRLGVHDAAAARAAAAGRELTAARETITEIFEELESAVFHAKQNDELFQDARLQLLAATAEVARSQAELRRHQVEPKKLAKRVLAGARNRLSPR
jgi:hypothetical protein